MRAGMVDSDLRTPRCRTARGNRASPANRYENFARSQLPTRVSHIGFATRPKSIALAAVDVLQRDPRTIGHARFDLRDRRD